MTDKEEMVCSVCGGKVTWVRVTQFAGNHYFCTDHAKAEEDFMKADDYAFWVKSTELATMPPPKPITPGVTVFATKEEAKLLKSSFKKIPLDEFRKTIEIGSIFNAKAYFDWSAANGFGQFSFGVDEDGTIHIDSECMGKETSRQFLYAFVDHIIDNGKFE